MVIVWAINSIHAPIDGNRFGFQRMVNKVKNGLLLSVVWCWRDTQSSLGLCFSFGSTIKGGMNEQIDLGKSSGLGMVHTCQTQHQVAQGLP